ncbi:DNA helicase PIF1, ATP-dependent [Tanacetum coccineum]
MGSLLPPEGMASKFAQLYFFDTQNEVRNRTRAFIDKETNKGINEHIVRERETTRQYNTPTVSEVAALTVNDFGDELPTRDIIVTGKDNRPKRVSKLHPSYMALQYPLLFPYGEDGTFTGSPRYMMQNYQDAMALCRTYGNPDLFITFTSNPKWPEISEMLAYFPGLKLHDRPEIGTRVFKIKLTELLDDLIKKHVFGESRGVVYVIEFQKWGLPYAHILLWLEDHCECKTPADIDDIISAELPSPIDDPDAYKTITNYMLHGPCGKDARNAACTTEGKCTKHFPKQFLAETFLDEEG